ncbi:MAG: ATP-dependent helicase [Candidatus Eremiobacteraeota bacterium]|nr:ATP-dependent helicase [Candidatus Eremiobacteraeota bacterium]
MRAELAPALTPALERVVDAPAGITAVTGPPGSGKTTALAMRAVRLAQAAPVLVICSHQSGTDAFRAQLESLDARATVEVGTAPQHCLRWLRAHYALAGVHPHVAAGGEGAAVAIVHEAAADLLDMSWPELRAGDFDLDLPFLSRIDRFLEEAATLIRQLRSARIGPDEFARACAAGITAFYGDEVEAALIKCADPALGARASRRGREALRASAAVLQQQKRAERALAVVLGRLYREYVRVARTARAVSDEDIVDECVRWLSEDRTSARALAASYAGVLVDDGEDAPAALADLLSTLADAGARSVTLAGWADAAIDGLAGRRSALNALRPAQRIELPPSAPAPTSMRRFKDEEEEIAALATALADLLAQRVAPADIAVLTRSNDAAAVYARRLAQAGLPIDEPLERFAAAHEIADWLALAAVVDDPRDHEHWLRVLASPLLGLSDASIFTLCEDPQTVTQLALDVGVGDERKRPATERQRLALSRNLLEGAIDERLPETGRELMMRFRATLASWRSSCAGLSPAGALARLAKSGGFVKHWQAEPASRQARLTDDMLRVIEAFVNGQAQSGRSLNELVRAFEDGALPVRPARRSAHAIACDIISGSKGVRWPYAFVVGLAHERFPRIYVARGMAFSKTYGLIVRENVAPGAAQTAKFAWYYARFDAKGLYLAEERRALRYGLSRGWRGAWASGFGTPPRWAKDYDLLVTEELDS